MSEHQESYPIVTMCRVLGVSPSGYYAWRQRPPSARAEEDAQLRSRIERIHSWSRGTYGAPRIRAELADEGPACFSQAGGASDERGGSGGGEPTPANSDDASEARGSCRAPDLVDRNFTAHRPDQLWVADITCIGTWTGFLYLAVVVDAFSRRVVGWAMATHLRAELVINALNMAIWRRRPEEIIHHSDQGSQYTSIEFGKRCRRAGVSLSMGSRGDCYDNALCESFFATLECELLERSSFRTLHRGPDGRLRLRGGFLQPPPSPFVSGELTPQQATKGGAIRRQPLWKLTTETGQAQPKTRGRPVEKDKLG